MKIILISLLTLLLSACANTTLKGKVIAVDQAQLLTNAKQPLPPRPESFEEVFDTQAESARIILVDDKRSRYYQGAKKQLMAQLSQSANLRLGKLSGVVVKNDLSEELKNEIMLSESSGKEIGRQDIDFALYMGISAYTSDTSEKKKEKLFSDGYYFDCGVEAQFDGWFRLVEIPSMRVIQQVEFDENESESKDSDRSNGCYKRIYNNLFTEVHKEITSSAACNAINDIKSHLKPTGHVLGKSIFNKKLVYEISLTSRQGVEKGDSIEFSHTKNGNGYAEGKIVKVSSTSSFVSLVKHTENETVFAFDFAMATNNSTFSSLSCLF